MDYLLFSLIPLVTFLAWILWVRWDSGRYLNQRRIERRLQDYPLREDMTVVGARPLTEAQENELTLLREIATAYREIDEQSASAPSSEEAR